MKKSIAVLVLSISGVLYAQEPSVVVDSARVETLRLNSINYLLKSDVVNDSLNEVDKTALYPSTISQLGPGLKIIALHDDQITPYIDIESKKDTVQVKAQYINNKLNKGVVLEPNGDKDLAVVYYDNAIPQYRYIQDCDYHFYTFISSELDKNDEVRNKFYDLEEGELLPLKQEYVDGTWQAWDKELQKEEITLEGITIPATLYYTKDDKKERMMWKLTDNKGLLHYVLVQREGSMIVVYEQTYDSVKEKRGESYLNVASLINVGFDKKRVKARTENKESISDIYFENYGKLDWKKPNQYIFDYIRKSDKRMIRSRVILDKSITANDIFFDFIVALANNPELFRRDVGLKDFDYSQLIKANIIHLVGDKKPLYLLEQ
ncbi:hypothetical protein SAMN04488018_103148 [Myroides marinus]|uniref:Uncharacterized protein n=1 Tax=Myroides marinus TaxID=703342 RepID=A0A1H6SRH3_9FLAO|nr:hypothetical protein [Myroides marinus]SEI70381.1 hypothetical protein SAMN04488018_103148 [Myroides marinus]